jgi:hypothetical protein
MTDQNIPRDDSSLPEAAFTAAGSTPAGLRTLAREHLSKSAGNREAATSSLAAAILADPSLAETVALTAARYLVRQQQADDRQSLMRAAGETEDRYGSALVASARATRLRWLDQYMLHDGVTRLGDATRADLEAEQQYFDGIARRNETRAQFFSDIAKKVPAGRRVRDVLGENQISELAKKRGVS